MVGSGGANMRMGHSAAISADGSTAILGAWGENTNPGAAWVFTSVPEITAFNPTSAGYGDKVTIIGKNLSSTMVSFGGALSTFINNISINCIEAIVGVGASGSVTVSSPFGNPSLAGFTFLPPIITAFTPTSKAIRGTVTITGTNLTGATAVSFGGTPAASFNVVSSTSITAVLAAGSSGIVSISTPGDTTTLHEFNFLSSNAELSNLSLSSGTLTPAINSGTFAYSAEVPFTTHTLTITPTKAETNANGNVVISGNSSADLILSVGSNIIIIAITAQDGVTIKTYTLTVTRAKENQIISFAPLATKIFGDAAFTISATGGASGISPAFSSSNTSVATINGTTVTITGTGTTIITAIQAGIDYQCYTNIRRCNLR